MQHFDVTIIGAGMVGLSLARALHQQPLRIGIINRGPLTTSLTPEPELRVSAINELNRQRFEQLNIWQTIPTQRRCEYLHMHVWDQDSFGRIEFDAASLSVPQLGAIVENQALVNALAEQVQKQDNVTVIDNANIQQISLGEAQHAVVMDDAMLVSTSLLVGADGANSLVRKTAQFAINQGEYGQIAIVATVRTAEPHQHTARQVFTPHGPLALLPLADPNLCSIVWSQDASQAKRLLAMDESEFNKALSVVSNAVLGQIELASERKHFPLGKQYARQWLAEGVVLCGDAAHTFHPLAGQGANLGFEDAWMLADTLSSLPKSMPLQQALRHTNHFRAYERSRKTAAAKMLVTMESFHRLFTGQDPVKKGLRGLGLLAANALSPAKHALAREALGI